MIYVVINTDLILKYTTALYTVGPAQSPSYDEFRDMFSSGQILSKIWLVKEVARLFPQGFSEAAVACSWFSVLAHLLKMQKVASHIRCIDSDPRCKFFVDALAHKSRDDDWLKTETADIFECTFSEGLVINTACEHIADVETWLKRTPKEAVVALQTTDFRAGSGHINCVDSVVEFEKMISTCVTEILFSGELVLPIYRRFMVIAKV